MDRGDLPVMRSWELAGQSTATITRQNSDDRFANFDLRGAVRVASSSQLLAPLSPETLPELRDKHPLSPVDIPLPAPPDVDLASPVIATVEDVMKAMKYFPHGCRAGPDGLRPVTMSHS